MKRPLILVALLYVAGVLLAALPVSLVALFVVSIGVLILFAIWPDARRVALCALIILTGWINLTQRTTVLSPNDLRVIIPHEDKIALVRGVLRETPLHRVRRVRQQDVWTTIAQIEVTEVQLAKQNWQPAFGRMVVNTKGYLPDSFFAGQTVEIDGTIKEPPGATAKGLFDYGRYLEQLGIYHELTVKKLEQWRLVSSPNAPPISDRFCAWARKTLALGLPYEDESLRLEWALTLGWKAALTDEVSEPFVRAATFHIFAVDGLRIAIVSGIFLGLFRVLGVPRAYWGLLTAPFLLFYAAMTGWPASAIRAIVMIAVVFGGWALKRPSDLINSLFAAALIILLWEPRQLFQAGFQLSFFVVLCIILILPFFNKIGERVLKPDPLLPESLEPRWKKMLRPPSLFVIDLFLTSLAAWLGSIPLVAWYFHILTPSSGPANVLAVPLCGLVLVCNLASLLFGAWFPYAAELFNNSGWFWMEGIRHSSQWSAHWPGAYYYVPMPGYFTIAIYYIALITIFTGWLLKNPYRVWKISGLVAAILVWCGLWLHERPVKTLTILPTGNAYAAYLHSNNSFEDWLIDCGNESSMEMVTKPFLRAQGVNRLSHFIATHGEMDFIGGAQEISQEFAPRHILLNPLPSRSPVYRDFERSLKTNSAPSGAVKVGEQIGPWTVLHPDPAAKFSRGEDNAIVLLGNINGVRVLLLSDLGHQGQNDLLAHTNDLRADIVVSAIPGEGEPLNDRLLDAIQPRVIIIEDSEQKRASEELEARLARRHLPVFYMRRTQAVTVSAKLGDWKVEGMDHDRCENSSLAFRDLGN